MISIASNASQPAAAADGVYTDVKNVSNEVRNPKDRGRKSEISGEIRPNVKKVRTPSP